MEAACAMSEQTSAQYFRMRAEDERRRSQEATDLRAAKDHADMAVRYDQMANRFDSRSGNEP